MPDTYELRIVEPECGPAVYIVRTKGGEIARCPSHVEAVFLTAVLNNTSDEQLSMASKIAVKACDERSVA